MKLVTLGLIPAFLGLASGAKRPVYMYLNDSLQNWYDLCPDIMHLVDNGIQYIIPTFLVDGAMVGASTAWEAMTPEARKACKERMHAKGAKLLLSTGGATEHPYGHISGEAYGIRAAKIAIEQDYDGIDFDLEGLTRGFETVTSEYGFIHDCSISARKTFNDAGMKDAIIVHAPQSPYAALWAGPNRGYVKLIRELGDVVDAYLFQFYNQEQCLYTTYETLFIQAPGAATCFAPESSWGEIVGHLGGDKNLINKVVVGKPATTKDVYNTGYIAPAQLKEIMCKAEAELGYTAGLMAWAFRGAADTADFFNNLTGDMCGEGGAPAPTPPPGSGNPTTKPPTAPTPAPTPAPSTKPPTSGGPCKVIPGMEPWAAYCVLPDCATVYHAYCQAA